MTTLDVVRAGSLWYPIMLAQEKEEISESKGAELLGMNILEYRTAKENAINAVMRLVKELPSPFTSLLDILMENPEFLEQISSASNSSGKENQRKSA